MITYLFLGIAVVHVLFVVAGELLPKARGWLRGIPRFPLNDTFPRRYTAPPADPANLPSEVRAASTAPPDASLTHPTKAPLPPREGAFPCPHPGVLGRRDAAHQPAGRTAKWIRIGSSVL